jgi:hypothetical protein
MIGEGAEGLEVARQTLDWGSHAVAHRALRERNGKRKQLGKDRSEGDGRWAIPVD